MRHTGGLCTILVLALAILGTACGSSSKTASVSDFCAFNKQSQETFGKAPATPTPKQVKQLYAKLLPALDHASAIAPAEIKTDFQTITATFRLIDKALAKAGYDESKVDPAAVRSLTSAKMTAAQNHVEQYTSANCHPTTSTT